MLGVLPEPGVNPPAGFPFPVPPPEPPDLAGPYKLPAAPPPVEVIVINPAAAPEISELPPLSGPADGPAAAPSPAAPAAALAVAPAADS